MGDVKPFGKRIKIGEIGSAETVRDSGIVLPPVTAERTGLVKGLVIDVGEGVFEIQKEMTVYFREHTAYDIGGHVFIDVNDVIAFEDAA